MKQENLSLVESKKKTLVSGDKDKIEKDIAKAIFAGDDGHLRALRAIIEEATFEEAQPGGGKGVLTFREIDDLLSNTLIMNSIKRVLDNSYNGRKQQPGFYTEERLRKEIFTAIGEDMEENGSFFPSTNGSINSMTVRGLYIDSLSNAYGRYFKELGEENQNKSKLSEIESEIAEILYRMKREENEGDKFPDFPIAPKDGANALSKDNFSVDAILQSLDEGDGKIIEAVSNYLSSARDKREYDSAIEGIGQKKAANIREKRHNLHALKMKLWDKYYKNELHKWAYYTDKETLSNVFNKLDNYLSAVTDSKSDAGTIKYKKEILEEALISVRELRRLREYAYSFIRIKANRPFANAKPVAPPQQGAQSRNQQPTQQQEEAVEPAGYNFLKDQKEVGTPEKEAQELYNAILNSPANVFDYIENNIIFRGQNGALKKAQLEAKRFYKMMTGEAYSRKKGSADQIVREALEKAATAIRGSSSTPSAKQMTASALLLKYAEYFGERARFGRLRMDLLAANGANNASKEKKIQ